MPDVDWNKIRAWLATVGQEMMLLSPQVVAALIILIGVMITAAVTSKIAKHNRLSAERTASDRLESEQKQKALDRSFPDRARTYLKARKWLRQLGDLASHGMLNDIWDDESWAAPFSESERAEIRNEIEVYGTSNAAQLFEATADVFMEACRSTRHSHQLLAMRRKRDEETGLETPLDQYQDGDWRLQQVDAEWEGRDLAAAGYQRLEQFTKLIQDDLADADAPNQELVIAPVDHDRRLAALRKGRRELEGEPPEGETTV